MTENKPKETYYYDPTTGERVKATYLVTLVVPSNYVGQIELEAESQEEAARLALEKANEIDWECPRLKLYGSTIEVLDVECDNPPEGALVSRPSSSEADISEYFEHTSADELGGDTTANAGENSNGAISRRGERCK